jgi:GNAT superfamily N-acetyltransferase
LIAPAARPAIEPPTALAAEHIVHEFRCGVLVLDEWLARRAWRNEMAGASRTFVLAAEGRVIAYYSLAAATIAHGLAPGSLRRNMPDPIPAALLGRLAVDLDWRSMGLGGDMLADAVARVADAGKAIGIRAIIVHAISLEAKRFYEAHGFRPSPVEPMTLMVTVEEALRMSPSRQSD